MTEKQNPLRRVTNFVTRDIWLVELASISRFRAFLLRCTRVLILAGRGFHVHKSMVQAAALTYFTVLSIVPVLAVSFAAARGLGFYDDLKKNTIVPFLDSSFGAAAVGGEASAEGSGMNLRDALDYVLGLVDKASGAGIGVVGFAILFYIAVKLISAIERALNEVWGVRRGRSWARRFSDYIAIVIVTPVLLLLGTVATAALRTLRLRSVWGDVEVDLSGLMSFILQAAPLISIWIGLTFAYLALPNTRVRIKPAMVGGIGAALLWLASQYLYVELQYGVARYNEFYAALAAFPIFLVWTYASWVIFLVGAELSYAQQNVSLFTSIARTGTVDHAFKESLALRMCGRIADHFLRGLSPWSAMALATELGVSPRAATQVLDSLVGSDLLARSNDGDEDVFLPARDPDSISVADVLESLKIEEGSTGIEPRGRLDERVDRVLAALERESRESLHNYTLHELARAAREEQGEEEVGGELAASPSSPSSR